MKIIESVINKIVKESIDKILNESDWIENAQRTITTNGMIFGGALT